MQLKYFKHYVKKKRLLRCCQFFWEKKDFNVNNGFGNKLMHSVDFDSFEKHSGLYMTVGYSTGTKVKEYLLEELLSNKQL